MADKLATNFQLPPHPPLPTWNILVKRISKFGEGENSSLFTCRNCGGGDRGRVAIYRPFGEFRRAKIALSPVWCSRPTTGVPLAHATMNFVGLDLTTSDRCFLAWTLQLYSKVGRSFVGNIRPCFNTFQKCEIDSWESRCQMALLTSYYCFIGLTFEEYAGNSTK
ncbi:hypothetical protein TNCV_4554151 [Trichonephila clavipes]|nr:hypothetical protein TNCV_4554151 [Trichonephila clavipes]